MEVKGEVIVNWPLGLHIRPATKIVQMLKPFSSEIRFYKDDVICNAKSLIQLLTLEAGIGDSVNIHAIGEDAREAVDTITIFFQTYKDEEDGVSPTY